MSMHWYDAVYYVVQLLAVPLYLFIIVYSVAAAIEWYDARRLKK